MKVVKNGAMILIGWVLIILGIAGLFLPFLQGILFIALGSSILSFRTKWGKEVAEKLKKKYSKWRS